MNRSQLFFSHQIESACGPAQYESDSKVQCGSISRAASAALAVVLLLSVVATPWTKPSYEVLYRFHGKDGAFPPAGLIREAAGNLYGTNTLGGDLECQAPAGCGVVFKLTP
jgi:hypothetical protein